MLNLMLFNGAAAQNVRINAHKWSLVGPHPPSSRRLVQRACGNMRTVAAGSMLTEWFLEGIDGSNRALSIGYTANGSLAQNVKINECVPAYLYTQKALDSLRPNTYRNYKNVRPAAMWDLTKVIETSNVWLGVFASGAVTTGAARIKLFYGFVAKLGDKKNVYFVGGDSGALALGLGGSLDAGFGIMTGFKTAQKMVGHTAWDLGFQLGPINKFARSVKALQYSEKVSRRGANLLRSLRALRALRFPGGIQKISDAKGQIKSATKLAGIGTRLATDSGARGMLLKAASSLDTHEGAKALLGLAGVDGTSAGLEIMSAGVSCELSVYGGVSQITFAVKV